MSNEIKRDAFPLKVSVGLGIMVRKLAKANRRKINEELNIAIEEYVEKNKAKLK
jgi:hypothetical protein